MTTQHDEEHRRSGGLRGAVNELFGRGDRDDTRDDDHLRHEGETVRPDSADRTDPAYADDPGLGRDPAQAQYAGDTRQAQYGDARHDGRVGDERSAAETTPNAQYGDAPVGNPVAPQGQYAGEQQTTYGGEMRGDTATAEHVRQGGDPTAQGQVQHGGEFQGDPNLPGHAQYDTGQAQDTRTMHEGLRDDVRSDTRDDVHSGPQGDVRDHIRDDLAAGDPATASTAGTAAGTTDDLGRDTQARDAGSTPAAAGRHEHATGASDDDGDRAQLVAPDRAESYGSRWDSVKGEFVDEPRRAVADADALVGELLDELQELFRAQRAEIEHGLDNDEASTEDLRVALRRYRSFFDRLLSI